MALAAAGLNRSWR